MATIAAGVVAVTLSEGAPADEARPSSSNNVRAGTVPAASHLVTCWDGQSHRARGCGVPTGRAGLATVFSGLTDACTLGPAPRRGAVEVFVCHADDYLIRYTRWQPGFDRFKVLDHIHAGTGSRWRVGDQFAGRTWTSTRDGDTVTPAQWTATYRAVPLSVDVLAADSDARTAGIAAVHPVAPSRVGHR